MLLVVDTLTAALLTGLSQQTNAAPHNTMITNSGMAYPRANIDPYNMQP